LSSIVRYFTGGRQQSAKSENSSAGSTNSAGVGGVLFKADEVDAGFSDRLRSLSAPISDGSFVGIVRPEIAFKKCYEYYGSIGKVQNAVDSIVAKVISRGWYFESAEAGQKYEPQIKTLNKFETDKNLSLIFEYWVRDWHVCGNSLLDLRAWVPVQMSSIDGLTRSKYGLVEQYIFLYNGEPISLKPGDFLHTKWIDADRQAWAMGAYHAIFNDSWQDPDVKRVKSTAAIMRIMQQDVSIIHHKFASPRVIYGFENVNKEVFDRDIAPLIGKLKAGDRLALSKLPTLVSETVDGTARFTDSIDLINAELQAGLQASTNPILTQPQPLGTSRVGNSQDDERALGVMEKIRRLMDSEIIPRVIGEQYRGRVIFKWGKQDDYTYIPQELQVWLEQGVISKSEVREMLRQSLKLDDLAYAKDIAEQEAKQKEQFEQQAAMKEKQRSGSIARPANDLATEAIVKAAEAVAERAKTKPRKATPATKITT
jgi:hypothetical protein